VIQVVQAPLLEVVFSGVKPLARGYIPLLRDFTHELDSLTTLLRTLITGRGISTRAGLFNCLISYEISFFLPS
jgi:hypothetical protein